MNENATKWVEVLRSGEYKQARLSLRVGDRFCCLGVLCDLYRKETGDGEWVDDDFMLGDRSSTCHPPGKVSRWVGLTVSYAGFGESDALTDRNDNGTTFAQIADIIESEPEGLFA